MIISRRQFLLLASGLAGVCQTASLIAADKVQSVNSGAVNQFAKDGVYNTFRDQGFFIVRKGDKLFALSAICTHRKCKLTAQTDRSFYCKCHGSTFDPDGHVTAGPARRNLPVLSTHTNEHNQLLVDVPVS